MAAAIRHQRRPVALVVAAAFAASPSGTAFALQMMPGEERLCADAEWVFVGTVVRRHSYYISEDLLRRFHVPILTTAGIAVERTAHGSPPPFVDIVIMGGTVGETQLTVREEPDLRIGERYLLFVSYGPGSSGLQGDIGLRHWIALDPDAELPREDEMRAIWLEHCAPELRAGSWERPTRKYLRLLSEGMLEWCGHY